MTSSKNHDDTPPLGGAMAQITAKRELADRIITAIAIGAYSPGEQLPSERELAERQGVSRVTIRGALEIVREQGLLNSKRGRGGGTFVTTQDVSIVAPGAPQKTLADEIPRLKVFADFRCLMAGLEARTAAERHTKPQAVQLQKILAAFCDTDDLPTARRLDSDLHKLITEMAANDQMAMVVAQLGARATMGFGSEPYPREYLARARKEHADMVEAIVARDPEAAYLAAYEHFSLTLTIIQDAFDRFSFTPSS